MDNETHSNCGGTVLRWCVLYSDASGRWTNDVALILGRTADAAAAELRRLRERAL